MLIYWRASIDLFLKSNPILPMNAMEMYVETIIKVVLKEELGNEEQTHISMLVKFISIMTFRNVVLNNVSGGINTRTTHSEIRTRDTWSHRIALKKYAFLR